MALVVLGPILLLPAAATAAMPASATIAPGGSTSWQGDSYPLAGNTSDLEGTQTCSPDDPGSNPSQMCDVFELTVNAPPGYWSTHKGGVRIDINWADPNNDFDMFVYKKPGPGEPLGNPVGSSAQGGTTEEHVLIFDPDGTYLIRVNPFMVLNSDYTGKVSSFSLNPIPTVPGGVPQFRASHDQFTSHSEPYIAVDPLDPEHLVAGSKQYQNNAGYKFKIGTYVSFDGGHTWRDNGHLPGYPVQTGNEGNSYYITSDVWTAFDDEGNAYAMVLDNPAGGTTGAGWGMTLHKSTDGGRTWSGRMPIEEKSDPFSKEIFLSDKNAMVVDNYGPDRDGKTGNVYACWSEDTQVSSGGAGAGANLAITLKRSTDGGQTWSQKQFLSGADHTVLGCVPVVGPPTTPGTPGPVYAFWFNFGAGTIRMAKSTDGGQSFSSPTTVETINRTDSFPNSAFRVDSLPAAAVDPADGTLYVAWTDLHKTKPADTCPPDSAAPQDQICDGDILLTRSTDGGQSWSDPIRVNQDPIGNGKDQFQPQLAVTPGGQLDMMWFDRRNDPQDYYIDTYFGRSNDKGAHWHEVRVTKSMWDPAINPPLSTSGQFIGDYQGIAATDCAAFPFWQDTTLANLPTSDPAYSQWQEVFSADIPNTTDLGGTLSGGQLPGRCTQKAISRTPAAIGGRFVISRRAVKLARNGTIPVRVSCRTPLGCDGLLTLSVRQRASGAARRRIVNRKLGSHRFAIPTRRRNFLIRVKANRAGIRLVQRLRKARVNAVATVAIGNDIHGTVTRSFRLHRASPRH
jgi:hypothetical protein